MSQYVARVFIHFIGVVIIIQIIPANILLCEEKNEEHKVNYKREIKMESPLEISLEPSN